MGLFTPSSKPRRFHHVMIYSDEHSDRVRQIEQQARHELGMDQSATGTDRREPSVRPDRLRGVFTQRSQRRGRRHRQSLAFATVLMVMAIILLLVMWLFLGLTL
jgi:hypothetical protein